MQPVCKLIAPPGCTQLAPGAVYLPRRVVLLSAGLAGVGKSTALRRLHGCVINSVYIDKDTVNRALLGEQHAYFSPYYDAHVRVQSYAVAFSLACDALQPGAPRLVILDGQYGDKWDAPFVKEPLAALRADGVDVRLVYFHCGAQRQRERMQQRGEPRDDAK